MKKLFKPSTKTLSETDLFSIAATVILSDTSRKKGVTYNKERVAKQIHKAYETLLLASEV